MSNTIPLPQPDAYEYLIADVWRTQTHWNGVKASAYRCLYATEKMHAHAAAVSATKDGRIKVLEDALRDALDRMDRARNILTDGKPRPECNWGMLATEAARAVLSAAPPPPEPDCRTCAHYRYNNIKGGSCYNDEHWRIRCVDGNQYNPLIPIQLWKD